MKSFVFYKGEMTNGTPEPVVQRGEDVREAWHGLIDSLSDSDLETLGLGFGNEIQLPEGFEGEAPGGAVAEGDVA